MANVELQLRAKQPPLTCIMRTIVSKSLLPLKGRTFLEWDKQTMSLPVFRLSIFSVALFLIAQLSAQPEKLSEFTVCLPNSRKVRPLKSL